MTNAIVTIHTDVTKVQVCLWILKWYFVLFEEKVIVLCDMAGSVKNVGVCMRKSKTVLKVKDISLTFSLQNCQKNIP